ncbi:MAG: hypothetical protein ACM3SW_01410 [Actinomycetota bacterium]
MSPLSKTCTSGILRAAGVPNDVHFALDKGEEIVYSVLLWPEPE